MVIQITNPKALGLLQELEELELIKVLKNDIPASKLKLSDKYRGIISKAEGRHLDDHINQMRSEWNSIS